MSSRLRRVTVDLTPVLPGGDNGGAKLIARALVRNLSVLAADTQFTLLTSPTSHSELADLDAPNVRRQCVDTDPVPTDLSPGALAGARSAARVLVNTLLPARARSRVKDEVWTLVKRYRREAVSNTLTADLTFCPFTAPFFFDPRVPLVAQVLDLQFLDHPEFFDEQQRRDRLQHFKDACERADRLICLSDFVRQTVLANSSRRAESVQTIYPTVLHATTAGPDAVVVVRDLLDRLGVRAPRFLLYPANAWPHKNHRLLLEAFARFIQRSPASNLALVCTGAPGSAADDVTELARQLLPAGRFAFAGFVAEQEFAALLGTCRALIFPSLYEGFGLPVLEAMACNRPVLCSNITSLPEVVGDAALLFDAHDPAAIATAIDQLESEPELEEQLVRRGRERVTYFGSAREMAAKYLAAFEEVLAARNRSGGAAR